MEVHAPLWLSSVSPELLPSPHAAPASLSPQREGLAAELHPWEPLTHQQPSDWQEMGSSSVLPFRRYFSVSDHVLAASRLRQKGTEVSASPSGLLPVILPPGSLGLSSGVAHLQPWDFGKDMQELEHQLRGYERVLFMHRTQVQLLAPTPCSSQVSVAPMTGI